MSVLVGGVRPVFRDECVGMLLNRRMMTRQSLTDLSFLITFENQIKTDLYKTIDKTLYLFYRVLSRS